MSTPEQFLSGFQKLQVRFAKRHEDLKRGIGLVLFGDIMEDTPVDTGRLRSNWQASLNNPDKSRDSAVDKNGVFATNKLLQTALRLKGSDAFIFTNSLPYAYRIEYEGWSKKKAPQGMVNRNVLRFQRILKDQLSVVKSKHP